MNVDLVQSLDAFNCYAIMKCALQSVSIHTIDTCTGQPEVIWAMVPETHAANISGDIDCICMILLESRHQHARKARGHCDVARELQSNMDSSYLHCEVKAAENVGAAQSDRCLPNSQIAQMTTS